jgi:hypothetical protein
MRFFLANVVAAAALLDGCTIDIPTSGDTFSVEPKNVAHLRQPQALQLVNGYTSPSIIELRQSPHTFNLDRMQLTQTAITMLRRAMDQHGIAAGGDKTITLRIVNAGVISAPNAPAQVVLEAQFGDGTSTRVGAANRGFSAQRALDGAILFALNKLLIDEKFVAYVNK